LKKFNLFKVGVSDEMGSEFRRVTTLTNIVYVLIFFLLLPYLIYFLPDYIKLENHTFRTSVPWLAWFSAITGYVLNAMRRHLISKVFFMTTWVLFVTVVPIVTGGNHVVVLFMHPFYCIATSIMVHFVFSQKRERYLYYFFVGVVWALIIFSYEFILYYNPDLNITLYFPNGFFRWRMIILILAAFFNGSIIYLIRLNYDFYSALRKRNETISEQYKALECQRKDLEELKQMLEEKVTTRTQLLLEQNNQLREYTYFNAHILRAPVSRIRGLLYLLSVETPPDEEKRIRSLLAESMTELDQAIKAINDKLQQAELLEDLK
jgi:signal transduction histidine kinase